MTTIITPDPAFVGQVISDIIGFVGRTVTVHYIDHVEPCPVCGGTNNFCLTCGGSGKLEVLAASGITASVKWKPSEKKRYRPEGQYLDGDCQVTFIMVSGLSTLLDKTRTIDVDNRSLIIKGYFMRGEPVINRILVVLNEDDRSDGSFRR